MARTQPRQQRNSLTGKRHGSRPLTKDEYIRQTLASCRNHRCCQDPSLLEAAYAQYINDPRAPWNKVRRG